MEMNANKGTTENKKYRSSVRNEPVITEGNTKHTKNGIMEG